MYDERIEQLIKAALADGVLTEKEKQVLFKRAQEQGIDLDEFEMVLDARLVELQRAEKEKAAKSAPMSNKLGDVRKCPRCGGVIGSFVMICPDCGFEFSNVGPNQYVITLSDNLEKTLKKASYSSYNAVPDIIDFIDFLEIFPVEIFQRRYIMKAEKSFIETYPMPMTKEDCVETLNYILPKLKSTSNNMATKAWRNKFDVILHKLELENAGNKKILELVATFREQAKPSKSRMYAFIAIGVIVILSVLTPISIRVAKNVKYRQQSELFTNYVNEGKVEEAEGILSTLSFPKGYSYYKKEDIKKSSALKLVKLYVANDNIERARNVYEVYGVGKTIIVDALINAGSYDSALAFCTNSIDYAEVYFGYMSEIVKHLCENGKKQEAIRFVKRYSSWFVENVDVKMNDESYKKRYGEYTSQKSKARLLNMINEY